jgi:hypothetical protein
LQSIDHARTIFDEAHTMAREISQFTLGGWGDETALEQAMLEQISNPLGITDIGVG